MEAVVHVLSSYALSKAQSDSINNISLILFYRSLAIMASEYDLFAAMLLDCQMVGTSAATWPRVHCPVAEFSKDGKIALTRLKEQIKLRLPELSAREGAIVILDPLTKLFATALLGGRVKFQASKLFLQQLHHDIYNIHNSGGDEAQSEEQDDTAKQADLEVPAESATAQRNLPFNLFAPMPKVQDTTDNPIKAADKVLEEYIQYKVNYNEFLLDGANKFSPLELQNLDLVSVIERFDSMKFLHAHAKKIPTICLLARSLMGRLSNSSFQKRVFLVAGNAMGAKQCRMAFSHLEKSTVLANNKELLYEGVFKNIM